MRNWVSNFLGMAIILLSAGSVGAEGSDHYNHSNENLPSFSVWAEFLYLKPCENGLELGAIAVGEGMSDQDVLSIEGELTVKSLKFKWSPGVRVGLGYRIPCQKWRMEGIWTHYHTDAKKNLSLTGPDAIFFPAWGVPAPLTGVDDAISVGAKWKLNLNIADFLFKRPIMFDCDLLLTPFMGVTAAFLEQKFDYFLFAPIVFPGAPLFHLDEELDVKSKFAGAGIKIGTDIEWKFSSHHGFSVYGQAAGSLLYGHYHTHVNTDIDLEEETEILDVNAEILEKRHHCDFLGVIDLGLGLRYTMGFSCDSLLLTLQLGWEQHLYFEANKLEDTLFPPVLGFDSGQRGRNFDLSLQGLTAGVALDF